MDKINIDLIKPYEKNAKKHPTKQIKQIAESIKEFGFNQPIVIDKNNIIIVGHGRWLAAKELGFDEVPFLKVDLSEEQAKAYRLADNKLNESDWDMGLAIEDLKELSPEMFDLTGFDKDLLIEPDDKDDIIPDNAPTVAQKGDVWELGRHRVMCGDATKKEDVEKLMDKEAKLCFTSPPYNMANKSYYNEYKDNLESQKYIDFNIKVIKNVQDFIKGFLFWNISYNKNSKDDWIIIFNNILKETKFRFLENIVWDKGHGMPITQRDGLTRRYEMVLAGIDEDILNHEIDYNYLGTNERGVVFNKRTLKKLSNYWYIDTFKSQNEINKACFPVALPVKGIILMTKDNDIVLDPFIGSGSTLIACEKTNRICYGMEIDPKYVDVIIKRWEDYTGNKAKKV